MRIVLGRFRCSRLLALGRRAGADRRPTRAAAQGRDFSFEGPFGTLRPRRAAARLSGLQGSLLGLPQPQSRRLPQSGGPGGPGFTEAQAKAIAAGYKIPADPNDKGEIFDDKGTRLTRAGIPADHFPPPFPNEEAARAPTTARCRPIFR